jgi:hypothetical protein
MNGNRPIAFDGGGGAATSTVIAVLNGGHFYFRLPWRGNEHRFCSNTSSTESRQPTAKWRPEEAVSEQFASASVTLDCNCLLGFDGFFVSAPRAGGASGPRHAVV